MKGKKRKQIKNTNATALKPEDILNKSLAEILIQARKKKRIKLENAAQKTKIPLTFLSALENEDWAALPAAVYVRAYLKKYCHFLGLSEKEILARYRSEFQAQQRLTKDFLKPLPKIEQGPRLPGLRTRYLAVLILIIFFLFGAGYIFWQMTNIITPPPLSLESPPDNFISSEAKIKLTGQTNPDVNLTINGQRVYPGSDGYFEEEFFLIEGLNTIEIKAVNSFGKETVILRKILYSPPK